MTGRSLLVALVTLLGALMATTKAEAWGACHVGYTHYGPATGFSHRGYTGFHAGGVGGYGGYHAGATHVGGYGGADRLGYHYGGFHGGYGGYHYGGYHYGGGGVHYGYARRW